MKYKPHIHNRQSTRLKGYDYARAGLYFITLCCQDRAHLFGHIKNGEMVWNEFGRIAAAEWQNTKNILDNCRIHEFVVMPNHIHGIIEIVFTKGKEMKIGGFQSPSQTIGSIIRGFKIATIKKIKEKILSEKDTGNRWGELQFAPTESTPTEKIISLDFKIWQPNYWDHIIRNEREYQRISQYIINNPKKWEEDKLKR